MHFTSCMSAALLLVGAISAQLPDSQGYRSGVARRVHGYNRLLVRTPQAAADLAAGADSRKGGQSGKNPAKTSAAPATSSTPTAGNPSPKAGAKTFVVQVGNKNVNQTSVQALAFVPNTVTAAVGDVVEFQFNPRNHTVSQASFDAPCMPLGDAAFNSGYVPVGGNGTEIQTYSLTVKSADTMWLYCAQGPHCQLGMTMVINPSSLNTTQTLANFQAAAAKATANIPPSKVQGGTPGLLVVAPGS